MGHRSRSQSFVACRVSNVLSHLLGVVCVVEYLSFFLPRSCLLCNLPLCRATGFIIIVKILRML